MSAAITVAVVICTRRRSALLRNCLEGIRGLTRQPDEVIVVDNTSGEPEVETIAEQFSALYVVEPTPGLSRARNRGLAESSCDVVAYLDDDATPDPEWLGLLIEPFQDAAIGLVTGRIITPESIAPTESAPRAVSSRDAHWFEMATFGGLGAGSNMALRRAACRGWTVFDERLGRGAPFQIAEENYAFASLLSRGHRAVYLPHAIVNHGRLLRAPLLDEARNSFGYWLLLLSDFPERRGDLLRFLGRRLARRPLGWSRESHDPGEIVTSGIGVQVRAALSALVLFLRTRKPSSRT